jgi:hypothetical protein
LSISSAAVYEVEQKSYINPAFPFLQVEFMYYLYTPLLLYFKNKPSKKFVIRLSVLK